jgi:hypothetical protein
MGSTHQQPPTPNLPIPEADGGKTEHDIKNNRLNGRNPSFPGMALQPVFDQ